MQEKKKESKFTIWLNSVDEKAKNKGKWINTLWQYVKFTAVSLLITGVQLGLVNLLYFFMKGWYSPLTGFMAEIFSETTLGVGHSSWAYLLPFFLSNLIANTLGYILNKHKTFKSDAPAWHYIIYIALLIVLIAFSTWLQGVITNVLVNVHFEFLAPTIAALTIGIMQGLILFPLQKFVLLKEKKSLPETSNKVDDSSN